MPNSRANWLIETGWLAEHLEAPDIVVVDASWFLPTEKRSGAEEYKLERIPGAVFFDIDEIADSESDLPHMLPSPVKFSARMRKLGIGDGTRIVTYDSKGIYGAARAWWSFRAMGVSDVLVLNGGLPKWKAEGHPMEDGPPLPRTERHFTARRQGTLIADRSEVEAVLQAAPARIADARSAERFAGKAPEPRAGLRGGHMPGACNVPYTAVLNPDGTLKQPDEIRAVFAAAGVDPAAPVVTTCGSGVTACILALALSTAGNRQVAVYDGSWAEWGVDPALPVTT